MQDLVSDINKADWIKMWEAHNLCKEDMDDGYPTMNTKSNYVEDLMFLMLDKKPTGKKEKSK